ncbi:MAG: 16S rRNA (cytidine(1402)-2'-O)-methyltransferase [Clostridiaceae bacterium]|nr:16S rRNA (cytidine(1402)-2'-O)-methyltransferase [Clostridiaceae bacterium]
MLFIVGTPIGNVLDISSRAKEVLSSVDRIACEDTRRTGLLLQSIGVQSRLISYHEHNRAAREEMIVRMLSEGQDIALVSDAGMPCISDPGEQLVRLCHERGIAVTVIPGPTAFASALALSGLDSRRFVFEGFLPSEGKERRERIRAVCSSTITVLLYEAPHRLQKTLIELAEAGAGNRQIVILRELTKKYEEVMRFTVNEAAKHFCEQTPKGEFVLVIEGEPEHRPRETLSDARILELHASGLSTREIASVLSKETGLSKNVIYSKAVLVIKYRKETH